MMKTVADLLKRWEVEADFARDIGVSSNHLAMIKKRNSLPPGYWAAAIAGAKKRGIKGISMDSLARLAGERLKTAAA